MECDLDERFQDAWREDEPRPNFQEPPEKSQDAWRENEPRPRFKKLNISRWSRENEPDPTVPFSQGLLGKGFWGGEGCFCSERVAESSGLIIRAKAMVPAAQLDGDAMEFRGSAGARWRVAWLVVLLRLQVLQAQPGAGDQCGGDGNQCGDGSTDEPEYQPWWLWMVLVWIWRNLHYLTAVGNWASSAMVGMAQQERQLGP